MVEMERTAKRRSRQRNKAKKPPKVPIKTYRWEDIRRSRRRGGYPWTHLYKKPFTEVVDPEQFTMDSFRRAKSSSPMGRLDISEVSSWVDYSGKTTPTLLNELINEPDENVFINKPSHSGSVVIQDITDEVKESSEGSDNISQLLDKDEGEAAPKSLEADTTPTTSNRKRERSVESSRSKYSLSNLSVIKKLQEAKSKMKVPKLAFPTKKKTRKRGSPPKDSPKKLPKKASVDVGRRIKSDKPVYIHIPLKPPPGETDEFSYLEFEPQKDEIETVKTEVQPERNVENDEDLVNHIQMESEVKPLKDEQRMVIEEIKPQQDDEVEDKPVTDEKKMVTEQAKPEQNVKTDEEEDKAEDEAPKARSRTSTLERGQRVSKKPPLKINPAFKQLLKDVREMGNREEQAQPQQLEEETIENEPKPESGSAEAESNQNQEQESPKKDDVFDKLFKASASSTSTSKPPLPRSARSKSAEPQTKRRSSLESSYSRKSLSKLAIMKRLKEASDKIKNAFSIDSFKRKLSTKTKKPEEDAPKKPKPISAVNSKHLMTKPKNVEPVYIHIPLKPPEGQSDEFSYLAETPEAAPETAVKPKEERTDSLDSTSPLSPANGPVQFIFLTPPSDDEILDKDEPDVPETPSSDEMVGFTTLKKLAKDAVDQVTPKTLETVSEETVTVEPDKPLEPLEPAPKQLQNLEETPVQQKMIVDVEDGLNEPPEAVKSKKRVSFKRKSKVQDKVESEYEVIEQPKSEDNAPIIAVQIEEDTIKTVEKKGHTILKDINVSMSMDEEKTYLDQKIVKDTSLEEDYNKWSKVVPEDHEYEPISPPDEMTVNVAVVDEGNDPKVIISAVDILDEPVEEKKKSFFQVQFDKLKDKRERRKSQDSETHSKSSRQDEDIPAETPRKPEGPSKLQAALKQGAEQIKTKSKVLSDKLHNIHLPKAPEFKKPNFKGFKLPKIPDSAVIHVPNISLPGARKITETKTVETRQYSTESNADDSERQSKRKRKFDLSFGGTFPRFMKKNQSKGEVVFATVPRAKKSQKSSVLSSEGSSNPTELEEEQMEIERLRAQYGNDDFDRRFSDPVEDYERENQEINREDYLSRWQHGNFKDRPDGGISEEERIIGELVEQRFGKLPPSYANQPETLEDRLRRDEARPPYIEIEEEEFDIRMLEKSQMVTDLDNLEEDQGASSEGSGSLRRRGRLGQLDINSDEFFVVHEIREGFQTPANALAQMNEYDPIGSNRSLPVQMREPPVKAERKSIKKPKRKKTPHVSHEEIPGDEDESMEEAISPSKPKRRSKRLRKRLEGDEVIVPYQQTIQLDSELPRGPRFDFPRESLGILGDDEGDDFNRYGRRPRQLQEEQPNAPPRKHRSLKSLTQSENESTLMEESGQPPRRPSRRSNSNTSSLSKFSAIPGSQGVQPCVEEPCVQDIRDYMGYAIVDKTKQREPPLPPPRTPPPRKKRDVEKFSTVPRNLGLNRSEKAPVRPLRNYSTLSHVRGSKPEDSSPYENDNKENEVVRPQDEEVTKDLVSGEIVQKMRQRPLPAPPRPPRKPKTTRRSLQDITSKSNLPVAGSASNSKEENVSTQTEPLPPDFVCEEIRQDESDILIAPRTTPRDVVVQRFELYDPRVHRELITPTQYSFEETVTHGTLVVKPLDGSKVLPDHQLSKERIVPVSKETSDEEPSEVPESFKLLRDPPGDVQPKVVKAELIQAADLDVERLRVNQLLASKVIVSELDASSIATNEITGKGGPVVLNDVELPHHILEQLIVTQLQQDQQKKTPTDPNPPLPVVDSTEVSLEPPLPPPRGCTLEERSAEQSVRQGQNSEMLEPEVDDQPPPRPPQPSEGSFYLPSQPPPSFYALRARQYVDDNIPTAPRRKRQHRSRPVSRTHSTSDEDVSSSGPRRSPRLPRRLSEPSIPELSGRLIQACGSRVNNALKRLIYHLTENVLRNADGNQDLHVFMIILLVLIAGLILLGYGEDRTVVHLHHWEYFNPPKDL